VNYRLPVDKENRFPNLRVHGYAVTSDESPRYNCVGWAAQGDKTIWWQAKDEPSDPFYWPDDVLTNGTLEAYIELFESLGYEKCPTGNRSVEIAQERVALYAYPDGKFAHVAYQLYYGWTSKLGGWDDIWHRTLEALECPLYGEVQCVMKRECRLRGFLARAFFGIVSTAWPLKRK
jgi:hypothetical protein